MTDPSEQNEPTLYDTEIHPLVERIALLCKEANLPLFLTIQEAPGNARTTCVNTRADSTNRLRNLYDLNQSWDIDEFLKKVIARAVREGHNSKYLRAMGIPSNPDNKEK